MGKMLNEKIQEVVYEILREKTYLEETTEIGAKQPRFEKEIYVDYYDKVSDYQLKKIMESKYKQEAFYDLLMDYVMDCEGYEFGELKTIIEDNLPEDDDENEIEYDIDDIMDFLREDEIVLYNFPYDHYLKTPIKIDVIVDAGDGDYDFTLNNFLSYNASEDEEIEEESGILWLVKQQGYTKEDLLNAIKSGTENKFLQSVIDECHNVSSHMNALSFFIEMTLGEYLDYEDSKEKCIKIQPDTNCGLYDMWMGSGSLLEIKLEKEVILPKELISIHMDGARGYGVENIYGTFDSHWKNSFEIIA